MYILLFYNVFTSLFYNFYIFAIEVIRNYKYYSKHKLVICIKHFSKIASDFINYYLQSNLKYMSKKMRNEIKKAYFTMMEWIQDMLLPFSTIAKNFRSGPLILLFSSLAVFYLAYYCKCRTNYGFVLCNKRKIWRHIWKVYALEKILLIVKKPILNQNISNIWL